MKALKALLFWLVNPGIPGFVPVFITITFAVVTWSQVRTIHKRNDEISTWKAAYTQRGDSLKTLSGQIETTKQYYDESLHRYKTELAEIRAKVGSIPARQLPAAIDENLRTIDSLLRQRP